MQHRIIINTVLKGIGVLGIILFLLRNPGSYYMLIGSVAALFMGVTDLGRQCPLILSARHILYRMKSETTCS